MQKNHIPLLGRGRPRTAGGDRAPAEEILIIGASLGAANELARSLAQAKRASFGYHRLTLGQLASALARPVLTAQRTVPLAALGTQAIANRAIHKLCQNSGLGRYTKLTSGPGFARAIANVITELRLEQIEPDALARVAPDLGPLLQMYERELAEHGFTDWRGVLHLAASAATDSGSSHPLLGLPTLLLDVPLTTAADITFVGALCARSPEMLITVPARDTVTLKRLRSELGAEVVDLDSHGAPPPGLEQKQNGSLRRLQRHIFNGVVAAPQGQLDEQVVVFSAPGENRECVEIVRRVLALAHEGVTFDRMAVLLRSPREYQSHLEEAFGRADVPVHFARGAVRPDHRRPRRHQRGDHSPLRTVDLPHPLGPAGQYISISMYIFGDIGLVALIGVIAANADGITGARQSRVFRSDAARARSNSSRRRRCGTAGRASPRQK